MGRDQAKATGGANWPPPNDPLARDRSPKRTPLCILHDVMKISVLPFTNAQLSDFQRNRAEIDQQVLASRIFELEDLTDSNVWSFLHHHREAGLSDAAVWRRPVRRSCPDTPCAEAWTSFRLFGLLREIFGELELQYRGIEIEEKFREGEFGIEICFCKTRRSVHYCGAAGPVGAVVPSSWTLTTVHCNFLPSDVLIVAFCPSTS